MTAVAAVFVPNASTTAHSGSYQTGMLFLHEGVAKSRTRLLLLRGFEEPTTDAGCEIAPPPESTTSGSAVGIEPTQTPPMTTAEAILEFRLRSGLTWDQIGELFGVSRRSVHNWANGKAASAGHERHIRLAVAALDHIDEGSRAANRARLLTVGETGQSAFDLLAARDFIEVRGLEPGSAPTRHPRVELSRQAREARRPTPPATLLQADQETPIMRSAKARIARSARTTKKTG